MAGKCKEMSKIKQVIRLYKDTVNKYVGLILASYVRSVWQKDDVLRKKFSSTEAVLQSTSPRLSQPPAEEAAQLSRKLRSWSINCTK